jgi:hypothetical protein
MCVPGLKSHSSCRAVGTFLFLFFRLFPYRACLLPEGEKGAASRKNCTDDFDDPNPAFQAGHC